MANDVFQVIISKEAKSDISQIINFIATDSSQNAKNILDKINSLIFSLAEFPNRGHIIPELIAMDENEFLEIHFKKYRIIYLIDVNKVFVIAVLDGRRNILEILAKSRIK